MTEWIRCPVCGNKTRDRIREDTVLKNYPLYCPKCKQETLNQSKAKAMEKEQKKLNKRLAELDRLFSSLYEDKVMERITERNFEMMSGKYQKEQLEIEARLREVTETLNESYEKSQGIRDFLSLIRNYQGLKELDATVVNALIDKILVSEREKSTDGTVRQEIKIYYKFIGFVGELHITPTKRWTALKPKNCTVCGAEYVPRSAISKYCPEGRLKNCSPSLDEFPEVRSSFIYAYLLISTDIPDFNSTVQWSGQTVICLSQRFTRASSNSVRSVV